MKKLLKGFTLAEVLISLAILGVVAVTTLPTLNLKISESQVGPALMKAINTLENVNNLAIKTNDVRRLNQIDTTYFTAIESYLNVKSSVDGEITTTDGIIYTCSGGPTDATAAEGASIPNKYAGAYYVVNVDINGAKAPNTIGKDQFTLWVDTKGSVIPYGGSAYNTYIGSADDTIWSTACPNGKTAAVTDPDACTGSVVDNNGKVLYNYRFTVSTGS